MGKATTEAQALAQALGYSIEREDHYNVISDFTALGPPIKTTYKAVPIDNPQECDEGSGTCVDGGGPLYLSDFKPVVTDEMEAKGRAAFGELTGAVITPTVMRQVLESALNLKPKMQYLKGLLNDGVEPKDEGE